ncbi:basement membrane-specific heparan sulfate proteoglycan core protein-like isoform X1 [Siniperca chuatsi]|uniref:basement membrane-specific heparan sulfate proteoglycan core protein-like isoform X1 n=1 Tax=Siniperca chuatsi TaxID=119488 RepID=UPI001CE0E399|nr:basement membrane-specific heparan sulfate proteoglycan core protein-like isoform X1 [Siniperca chuatsi]
MEVAALSLLLFSPTVAPKRSQFFKYDSFSVSCEEEELTGWRVMKRMKDGEVRPCPSSCSITAAFPATDSGVYWCETGLGETSNTVNITVTGRLEGSITYTLKYTGSVILESPVLPVMEGDDVTLSCRCKVTTSACDLKADFYKDGLPVGTSSTRNMTIRSVSRCDEGLYKCNVLGFGESPESWLTVRAPPAGQDPPAPLLSVSTLVRHLVVGTPYLLSTILVGLIYRDRARARHASKARRTSNDVIMEMAAKQTVTSYINSDT